MEKKKKEEFDVEKELNNILNQKDDFLFDSGMITLLFCYLLMNSNKTEPTNVINIYVGDDKNVH